MHEAEKRSLEQIQAFLNASQEMRFEGEAQAQMYGWIEQVLGRQRYHQQGRPARGLLGSFRLILRLEKTYGWGLGMRIRR